MAAAQAQPTDGGAMILLGANNALHKGDFEFLVCHGLPRNLFNAFTALGCNFGWRTHAEQAIDGCAHDVIGIGRADRLGNDISHADHFEDSPHRTTGNHACTCSCR
jgi:hypothetical protein